MEEPEASVRTTRRRSRNREADPEHQYGQSAQGRSPRARRVGEARHLDFPGRRVQVHGATPNAVLPDVAKLSQQSRTRSGVRRLLHAADGHLQGLFVFIVLRHDRRCIVHLNVTEYPSARWTAQQIVEAFPWDSAPRYLLRDRDRIYAPSFNRRVSALGVQQVLTAPRSLWQSPFVERVIGSLRRECLDQVIVLDERHLTLILRSTSTTIIRAGPICRLTRTRPSPVDHDRSSRYAAVCAASPEQLKTKHSSLWKGHHRNTCGPGLTRENTGSI